VGGTAEAQAHQVQEVLYDWEWWAADAPGHLRRWGARRDARIGLPLAALGRTGRDGIPYLVPEVQLYYKARTPRPKDEIDFARVLPVPAAGQRRWPAEVITCSYGEHPWVRHL
jgi:hypothetical protein